MTVHDFLPDEQLRRGAESSGFSGRFCLRQMDLQHERAAGDFFSRTRRTWPATRKPVLDRVPGAGRRAGLRGARIHGAQLHSARLHGNDDRLRILLQCRASGIFRMRRCAGCTRATASTTASPEWRRSSPGSRASKTRSPKRVLGEEAAQHSAGVVRRRLEGARAPARAPRTRRRKRVRELILSARNSGRDPFPNWKVRHA